MRKTNPITIVKGSVIRSVQKRYPNASNKTIAKIVGTTVQQIAYFIKVSKNDTILGLNDNLTDEVINGVYPNLLSSLNNDVDTGIGSRLAEFTRRGNAGDEYAIEIMRLSKKSGLSIEKLEELGTDLYQEGGSGTTDEIAKKLGLNNENSNDRT